MSPQPRTEWRSVWGLIPGTSHCQTSQKRIQSNSCLPYFTKQAELMVLLIFYVQKRTSPTRGAMLPFFHAALHFRISCIPLKKNQTSPHCLLLFILLLSLFSPSTNNRNFRGKFDHQAFSFNSCYNPAERKPVEHQWPDSFAFFLKDTLKASVGGRWGERTTYCSASRGYLHISFQLYVGWPGPGSLGLSVTLPKELYRVHGNSNFSKSSSLAWRRF